MFTDIVGGINKASFVDYPREAVNTIFLKKCALKCYYCFNKFDESYSLDYAIEEAKKTSLNKIVLSGGDPVSYNDLDKIVAELRKHFDFIALHTSGIPIENFAKFHKLFDWIKLDIKTFLYSKEITGYKYYAEEVKKALLLIREYPKEYMLRTTVCSKTTKEDLVQIKRFLVRNNIIDKWTLNREISLDKKVYSSITKDVL